MSFQQGLSGLNATSKNLEIIGNNIANSNTFGSKVSRGEFSDVYANALNGAGTNAVGIGTTLAAVSQQFTQGMWSSRSAFSETLRWTNPRRPIERPHDRSTPIDNCRRDIACTVCPPIARAMGALKGLCAAMQAAYRTLDKAKVGEQ